MPKKNFFIISVLLVIGIIGVAIISTSNPNTSNYESTNIAKTTESSKSIPDFETIPSVQDLNERLNQENPNEILLDVRTPEEFAQGHIQNAINLDMENPNFNTEIQKLDKSKTYIIFCRSGNRSLIASQNMAKAGLKVVNSNEGITSWIAAKLPVVK